MEGFRDDMDATVCRIKQKELESPLHNRINLIECVKKVKELLQRQPELFLDFQDFLPKGCDAKESCTYIEKHNHNFKDALDFVHKIKNRFSDNDQNYYTSFLHILNMYRTYQKSIVEVHQEVIMLFQDHDDLLKDFYCFMPNCSKGLASSHALSRDLFRPTSTDYAGGEKMLQIERVSHDEYDNLNTHLHDLEDNERTTQILSDDEISKCYGLSNTSVEHETNSNCSLLLTGEEVSSYEGHLHIPVMEEDKLMEIKLNGYCQKEKLSWSVSPGGKCFDKDFTPSRNADVYEDNPIIADEECDPRRENFSNCQRYDSSYCFLPKNYAAPRASYMTALDASVLNDRLVSVPSGSENCTFKFMRRNKYEKCLFRCEDDRFDMDMMLLKVALTSQKVEDLLEQVHSNKIELGSTFQIKDYLTDQNLKCIEQLYGDNGLEVVGHLCANASTLLPVISTRLKQKQEEGSRKRAKLEKVWSEACAKYYPRSLDYRSYQFKQQDKRNLTSEALLDECRQVNEPEEDNMLFKSVTGNRQISSIMVFEYADREIHDVLHKIMDYYCSECCNSKDEMDNIMRIWTTFLEPMFGVLTWLHDTENIKEKEQNSTSVPTSAHMDASLGSKDFATHLDYSHTSNASIAPIDKENVNNFKKWESVIHTGCGNQMDFYKNAHPSTEVPTLSDYEDEREEGELSPEIHLGDGQFLDFEDSATEKTVVVKNSSESLINYIEAKDGGTAMYDLNANNNNESTNMDTSDSSKAYRVVEDASVSEDYGANDAEESSCEHNGERKCVPQGFKSERMWVAEVSDADMHEAEGTSEQLSVSNPLAQHWPKRLHENRPSRIFYGNSSFYLLFRLHQILYDRILSSKINASSTETRLRALKKAAPPNHFAKFKKALYSYLNGGSTNKSKFEDDCFTFVGPQAYLLSTLDVLLSKLVKQLQEVASNKKENEFLQLYAYENSRRSSRSSDLIYLQNAYSIHHGDIFRFECVRSYAHP
ncbi:hypothetical protein ZIOFF_064030 [Zingiber officinale]|uniref:Histone deacetylase interacting domain-containing protein n=1 Tax=Zingiber officinale TaxID=94328 RepID=A0A8J5ES21_ZINOF|nr:hypothetical protein ZIOFF_064030 [Zingiber officinale]